MSSDTPMPNGLSAVIAEMEKVVREYAPDLNQHVMLGVCSIGLKTAGFDCFEVSHAIRCDDPNLSDRVGSSTHIWAIAWERDVYCAGGSGWEGVLNAKMANLEEPMKNREALWILEGESKKVDESAELGLFYRTLSRSFPGRVQAKQDEIRARLLVIGEHFALSQATSPGNDATPRPRL